MISDHICSKLPAILDYIVTCIIKSYMDYILQVLMKDIVTPVPPEEVRHVIKKCLENAALVNYTRISEYAKIEGKCILPK